MGMDSGLISGQAGVEVLRIQSVSPSGPRERIGLPRLKFGAKIRAPRHDRSEESVPHRARRRINRNFSLIALDGRRGDHCGNHPAMRVIMDIGDFCAEILALELLLIFSNMEPPAHQHRGFTC